MLLLLHGIGLFLAAVIAGVLYHFTGDGRLTLATLAAAFVLYWLGVLSIEITTHGKGRHALQPVHHQPQR